MFYQTTCRSRLRGNDDSRKNQHFQETLVYTVNANLLLLLSVYRIDHSLPQM